METQITWLDFLTLIIILILGYLFLLFIQRFVPRLIKRKSTADLFGGFLTQVIEISKPLGILIALLGLVSINYKVHGILLLLLIILSYSYIKSFINGIIFKINPLVGIGSNISIAEYKGEINKFLAFGIIITEADGNRFINYSFIDKQGFSINENEGQSLRKTIYLECNQSPTQILDLLFDNPLVNFQDKPSIKKMGEEKTLKLQITLENGASMDALKDYLNQYNIKTNLTKQ